MHIFRFERLIALLLLALSSVSGEVLTEKSSSAIFYTVSKKGRFGDKFLLFSHAAWFAYALKLPLVYQPFPYSDQLLLDEDPTFLREIPKLSKTLRVYTVEDYLQFYETLNKEGTLKDTLLEVPFYPDSPYLFAVPSERAQFTQIDWNDPHFKANLRKWFSPKKNFPKLNLPKDKVSIALHYRTGENYDRQGWQERFLLKGPPDTFYIDSLKLLLAIERRPLYVHLFTDSLQPRKVIEKFSALFPTIEFAIRTDKPAEEAVLEDFFAMEGFECMIRPESHFSMAAAYLFPYRIILSPYAFRWVDDKTILVDQITIEYNQKGTPTFKTTLRL